MKRAHLAVSIALACALAALYACNESPTVERCRNIPAGGCPSSNANVCADPSCDAVYACNPDRTWSLERTCAHDGGADVGSSPREAGGPRDANIDAPPGANGGPGCTELQAPDCALGVVLACDPSSCCGCEDLYVRQGGAWIWWGACAGGAITQADR